MSRSQPLAAGLKQVSMRTGKSTTGVPAESHMLAPRTSSASTSGDEGADGGNQRHPAVLRVDGALREAVRAHAGGTPFIPALSGSLAPSTSSRSRTVAFRVRSSLSTSAVSQLASCSLRATSRPRAPIKSARSDIEERSGVKEKPERTHHGDRRHVRGGAAPRGAARIGGRNVGGRLTSTNIPRASGHRAMPDRSTTRNRRCATRRIHSAAPRGVPGRRRTSPAPRVRSWGRDRNVRHRVVTQGDRKRRQSPVGERPDGSGRIDGRRRHDDREGIPPQDVAVYEQHRLRAGGRRRDWCRDVD